MSLELFAVVMGLVAAGIGAVGPQLIGRIPEPVEPAEGKKLYADVATVRGARWWMAVPAGVAAGLVTWRLDNLEFVALWVVLAGVGSWLAFIDWHTHYLPIRVTAPLYVAVWVLVGVAALLLEDVHVLKHALIANVIVYVVFRLLYWFASRFLGGAFGYGDVRLAAILAVALGPLGPRPTMVGLYAGFVLGAVFGIVLQRLRVVARGEIAFGPYLLAGAVVGAGWGLALYGG